MAALPKTLAIIRRHDAPSQISEPASPDGNGGFFGPYSTLPLSAKYAGTIERMGMALRHLRTDPTGDLEMLFRSPCLPGIFPMEICISKTGTVGGLGGALLAVRGEKIRASVRPSYDTCVPNYPVIAWCSGSPTNIIAWSAETS